MIPSEAHLNPKIFEESVERAPSRDGYGQGLLDAGDSNPNVVALSADLIESTRSEAFAKKYPERFFEMGIAEQNMVAVAAGLGVSGKIPFVASYATFSPGRNWEQVRTTVAYNDSNVKIAGHHAGISVGPDGATHQAIEDIATMRCIPNMKIFVPCDAREAKKATIAAAHLWGPVYLRFAREATPLLTTEMTPFRPGKAEVFWRSSKPQVLLIGCGPVLYEAMRAAQELEKDKIGSVVLNCHSIKPLDSDLVTELAKKIGAVVTVEEHSVMGGLGGAVAEVLAKNAPVPMEFIGMQDVFGESGDPDELLTKYGMKSKDIRAAAKKVVRRKK